MSIIRSCLLLAVLCVALFGVGQDRAVGQTARPSDSPQNSTAQVSKTQVSKTQVSKTPVSEKDSPKAVAVEPVFEFEPVLDGETVTHTFVIKNTGKAELKIVKVRTG